MKTEKMSDGLVDILNSTDLIHKIATVANLCINDELYTKQNIAQDLINIISIYSYKVFESLRNLEELQKQDLRNVEGQKVHNYE